METHDTKPIRPQPPYVLIDDARSSTTAGGGAIVFTDPLKVLTCQHPQEVALVLAQIDHALAAGHHVAGYMAYELGSALEPRLAAGMDRAQTGELIWMGVFDAPHILDPGSFDAWAQHPHHVGPMRTTLAHDDYIAQVEHIRARIRAGDVYQINHTFKQRFDFSGSALSLYAHLRRQQRARYGALIATGERHILSLSPELFVECSAATVRTRPMKGTAARAANPMHDQARMDWLCHDEKSRAENLMIVDLLRNDLGRIARLGSVTVTDLFSVETYPTLHQLTSGIEATLVQGTTFCDITNALFPCGSVTGAPKIKAQEIIRDLETEPRGVYTGAIGYASPGTTVGEATPGKVRFNVAIRTLVLADGGGEMGIGSGIVYDSDPEQEWLECHLKARFLTAPQKPFDLLETLLWEPQHGYVRLARHLARLQSSARYFCYPYDETAVRRNLDQAIPTPAPAALKVRLRLGPDGTLTSQSQAIETPARTLPVRFTISELVIDPEDPFVYHKTTNRASLDAERARQQARTRCDEVVFFNGDGELTEGSISNVFVEKNGQLLTPPVSSGLLAGTLRAELIDTGRAVERVLHRTDLDTADAIHVGNSVRGLRPARPA